SLKEVDEDWNTETGSHVLTIAGGSVLRPPSRRQTSDLARSDQTGADRAPKPHHRAQLVAVVLHNRGRVCRPVPCIGQIQIRTVDCCKSSKVNTTSTHPSLPLTLDFNLNRVDVQIRSLAGVGARVQFLSVEYRQPVFEGRVTTRLGGPVCGSR